MKTLLKGLLIIVAIIVFVGIFGFTFISVRGIPSYDTGSIDITVDVTPERIERGQRLASMICANCHAASDGKLTGRHMSDLPTDFGTAYTANITQHPTAGIADYTAGELAYLLRTGIKRDGSYTPPWMPKFPHMADEDIKDIIAFLQSDHWTVAPDPTEQPACEPSFLTKFLCRVAFKPLPLPEGPIALPDTTNAIEYGYYLATSKVDCYACHSEDFKTMNIMEPEKSPGYMGGGNTLLEPDGTPVLSANITMHQQHGIGLWTYEEFKTAMQSGKRPDGRLLSVAMPKFAVLNDQELTALWEYLRSIPEIDNDVAAAGSD